MKQMLNTAIRLAAEYHDGQYDKGGNPYILHVLKVMHYLKSDDEELNCIAVLHDIIEDTKLTWQELREAGISFRVIVALKLLTKIPGQTNEEYVEGICSNYDSIRVKKCDLRHNMDIRRLKGVSEKDMKRLDKYARTYHRLEEAEKLFVKI